MSDTDCWMLAKLLLCDIFSYGEGLQLRYLGVCVTRSTHFSCSFDNAKKSFYRSFNAIFGKIGRIAPENVVMQLIKSKCVPVLLYAVDACPTNRTLERSLKFPLTRIMMKIFKTNSKEIINNCQLYFGLQPISDAIKRRKINVLFFLFLVLPLYCFGIYICIPTV